MGAVLTALSVIEGFPAAVVPIDMAWGTFLASVVRGATTWVMLRRPAVGATS